jgi:hypothetical protein
MPKLGESTEAVNELIVEQVTDRSTDRKQAEEETGIALSTMLMALLAAFGALMAGISAHDALLDRTEEAVLVSIRESDRLAIELLRAKHDILVSLGERPDGVELAQIAKYDREATQFADEISREEAQVQALVLPHLVFSIAVTLLSVGIALNGIAAVTKKRFSWFAGMAFGLGGAIGIATGVVMMAVS